MKPPEGKLQIRLRSRNPIAACALPALVVFLAVSFLPVGAFAGREAKTVTRAVNVLGSADVRGYVKTKYVVRSVRFSGESASDQDLFEYARFDATAPEDGRYELHFFGTGRQDIDGGRDSSGFFPFEDIGDARDKSYTGNLYDAHIALNRPADYVSQVRIGRQAGTRDEPVFFDGVSADMAFGARVAATVYAGLAAHFEEVGDDWGEDPLAGAGVDITPASRTLVSLDYLFTKDDRDLFGFSDQDDHLFSVRVWQRFARYLRGMVAFRSLNGDARDVRVRAAGAFPEEGFEVSAGYFRQLSEQKELSNELSIYYDIVGETAEYQSFDVKVRKFIGEYYAIDVGYFHRGLVGDAKESAFNRDYWRFYAAIDVADLIREGLTLSVTGEYWKAEEDSFRSAGLDASYAFRQWGRRAEVSAGTYFSLYKYDYYVQRGERDDVQTYYARAVVPVDRHFSADGRYEFEDGRENYHTLSFGVRYDF